MEFKESGLGTDPARHVRLARAPPVPPHPYAPRDTQDSVLVNLLRDHLDAFIEQTTAGGGPGLPPFVERQLRAMVDCGDITLGFLRLECSACRGPRIVAFSCKARLCPSCAGRAMSEQAAHLVDRVLPRAPYRQWVLTLPWELARAVAFDADLCSRVFGVLAGEIARWQCGRARAAGIPSPRAGAIVEIQRFADGLRCWPHGHLMAPDGVFYELASGKVQFHGLGPPRHEDVETILSRVTERLRRLLERRAKAATDDDEALAPGRQLLLQCASVQPCDRIAVVGSGEPAKPGPKGRTGRAARRRKPLCARSPEGLELHAAVRVKAADRSGLERLCKYMARPAICEDRLVRLPDGRIEVQLKRLWKGGVRSLIFEPLAFIARLVPLIPLPRAHMRRFYGVFAPAHPFRSRVVPQPPCPDETGQPVAPKRPARMKWGDLLKRVFDIDALRCPYCGRRMWVVGPIYDPTAVEAIIAAVHLADARAEEQRTQAATRGPPTRGKRPAA